MVWIAKVSGIDMFLYNGKSLIPARLPESQFHGRAKLAFALHPGTRANHTRAKTYTLQTYSQRQQTF